MILTAGCQAAGSTPANLPSPFPWQTPASTLTPVFPTPAISRTPSPLPTPTTVMYKVASGETFISIASHFGITVDALRAANPAVQERFLSIGQTLVIPAQSGTPAPSQPTSTPANLNAGPVRCFAQLTGGTWCLVMIDNPGSAAVAGIRLRFSQYSSPAEEPVISRESALTLDILPAGMRAPAAVFFSPSEADGEIARVQVIGAVSSDEADRTMPLTILSQKASPLEGGMEIVFDAQISPSASSPAKRIEAVVTLLDPAGNPVGFRMMRSEGEWEAGSSVQFTLRVYSLGPASDRYELAVQAYP